MKELSEYVELVDYNFIKWMMIKLYRVGKPPGKLSGIFTKHQKFTPNKKTKRSTFEARIFLIAGGVKFQLFILNFNI